MGSRYLEGPKLNADPNGLSLLRSRLSTMQGMTQPAWNAPSDPTLRAVSAAAREEWRSDEEAAIADAASARHQGLSMRDWLCEAMARGDRLSIRCFQVRAAGAICEVDGDLLSLRNVGSGRIDLHLRDGLPYIIQLSEAAAAEPAATPIPSGGFRGRLLACENAGEEHSVWLLGEQECIDGRLQVGADTLTVESRLGSKLILPLSAVIAVAPRL
jgi:hypothetical protein